VIRISTTQIESYRRIVQTDYGSEEELIAQIMGKPFAPSHAMQAGSAWHFMLEHSDTYNVVNNLVFRQDDVDKAIEFIGPGVWEVKATKTYDLPGQPVTVVAQADHVHGKVITDNKLSLSGLDLKRYEPSLQWRLYLDIHQAYKFIYNRWYFTEPQECSFVLKEVMSSSFSPYPGLERDCRHWIADFLGWAASKNLWSYLERTGSSVSA